MWGANVLKTHMFSPCCVSTRCAFATFRWFPCLHSPRPRVAKFGAQSVVCHPCYTSGYHATFDVQIQTLSVKSLVTYRCTLARIHVYQSICGAMRQNNSVFKKWSCGELFQLLCGTYANSFGFFQLLCGTYANSFGSFMRFGFMQYVIKMALFRRILFFFQRFFWGVQTTAAPF